jgi:hypothetical protein
MFAKGEGERRGRGEGGRPLLSRCPFQTRQELLLAFISKQELSSWQFLSKEEKKKT